MNKKLLLSTVLLLICLHLSLVASAFHKSFNLLGDSIPCILFLELEQADNDAYVVSLISDTSWTFPRNIVSTAQVTVKVPTGGFEINDLTDLIDGVSFFQSGRNNSPSEAPGFDYISFSLGSQGTSSIAFEKGRKVGLFSFKNSGICPDGVATLMNNFSDPFYPPNSEQSNTGQQITVSGFGAPDLPIGIQGDGVSCNPTTNPVDTMTTTPVDTMTTTPVDTMTTTPVDTMTTTPVDTMTTTPVDTMTTTPVDTMTTTPVDTMTTTPVDTMTTTPVDTSDNTGSTPPFLDSDLSAQIAVQNISCQGANDGIIVLKAENGTAPYTYTWSTGATTATIENLFPGEYIVQIRDQTGFTIERTITILEPGVLIVQISKANASQAGASDGKGRAIVTGGTAPFSYSWSNQGISAEQTGLAEGSYSLTVTDANGCTDEETITIIDQSQCPVIDVLLDMDAPICAGESTGQILITPQGGAAPFRYVWENGNGTNFIRNIAPDLYMVTITDGVGCTMAVSAMLPDAAPLNVSLEIIEGNSPNSGQIAATVAGGMLPYTYRWSTNASTSSIENLGGGVYTLSVTDSKGCEKIVSGVISSVTCDLGVLDNLGTSIDMNEILCGEKGTLCIPLPLDSMIHYSIFLDGEDYSSNLSGCQFETFYAYSYSFFPSGNTEGLYQLREWVVDGVTYSGAFRTIDALVDSMNTWNPTGNWVNLKDVSIIQGGNPASSYGSLAIIAGVVSTILDVNSNLTPRGTEITFKPGEHQLIIVKNNSACSDTLDITLPCNGESRDSLINVILQVGEQQSLCLPPLFGNSIRVTANSCPDLSGTSATLNLDNGSNCIAINGLIVGEEEACYQITDINGNIINVTIKILVLPANISCTPFAQDTFYAFAPNCNPLVFCLEIPFNLIFDATINENGAPYTGGISACADGGTQFTFNQAGVYNLNINYGANCSQEIVLFVACDEEQVIEEIIQEGTIDVVCINLPGLLGTYETVENICPENSGSSVIFEVLANSGCISYTGIGIGTDSACIKLCDQFGFCDTVKLIYHVEDPEGLPAPIFEAVDDSATIRLNSSVVLDILGNDIFRAIDTIEQISEAEHGEVFINLDGTITYIAQTGYCDDAVPDIFQYSICEAAICDTATVSITITCALNRELVIYNGLSPNGDGVNESFRVDGIENYPSNKVNIYNRWGNRVFHMDGYKNEWTGTWSDRQLLPDGTYIYIIDLGDGSQLLKGYLEIRR